MKGKITLIMLALMAITSSGCKKLKFADKPYLKLTVDGTALNYEDGDVTAKLIEVNGTQVWVVDNERAHNNGNANGWFYVQGRSSLPLNQTNPVMRALNDDAYLKWNSKEYRLYNGTVNLKKMDTSVGVNTYMEGTFNLYLQNVNNAGETINVSGSFFHNNY